MSLQVKPGSTVPEETARVARAAFPKGNPYLTLRDELETVYTDSLFVALFSQLGQPAETPWRLALVTVLQFAEGLSDRQAADAVRGRIDWKYLLGLALEDDCLGSVGDLVSERLWSPSTPTGSAPTFVTTRTARSPRAS